MKPFNRRGEMAKMRFMISSSKMSMKMFEHAVERGEAISGDEIMLIEETVKLLELDWPTPFVAPEGTNMIDKARWWLEVIRDDFKMRNSRFDGVCK